MKTSFLYIVLMGLSLVSFEATAVPPTPLPSTNNTPPSTAPSPVVNVVKKVQTWTYDLEFRGSKVGQMTQVETTYADGKVVVDMNSHSTIKIMFSTAKNKTQSRTVYLHGLVQSFAMEGMQQNKSIKVKARRKGQGISVTSTQNNKTTERFYTTQQFQATSADLHLPMHKTGWKNQRTLLQLDQQQVVTQRLHYGRIVSQPWKGKTLSLQEVTVQGPRGKANMLFTPEGRMFQMDVRMSIFGAFRIVLRNIS